MRTPTNAAGQNGTQNQDKRMNYRDLPSPEYLRQFLPKEKPKAKRGVHIQDIHQTKMNRPTPPETVAKIRAMRLEGHSVRAIAEATGVSQSCASSYLTEIMANERNRARSQDAAIYDERLQGQTIMNLSRKWRRHHEAIRVIIAREKTRRAL